ncbi:sensor histidine kinase [uncultured Devosia sp.]|uniref:sensor histidine kinase n=1 Tax=uncultured Devosia sp. TaxID=211434 RepID=UPI0035CA215B
MSTAVNSAGSMAVAVAPKGGRRFATVVSLALAVIAGLSALFLVQGVQNQIEDVRHSNDVRAQAQELTIALSEAESNQRGYLLTGDADYLEPYERAASSIDAQIDGLIAATQNDAAQRERVQSIVGQISIKMAEMARTVELYATQRQQQAQTLTDTGMGARLMEDVRRTLGQFIAEENENLLGRNEDMDGTRRWLVGAILAALAGAGILGVSLLGRTRQDISALASTQNALRMENETLELRVHERTQALQEATIHAERERERVEALLQDTNHRIGNSLATVSSLLGLQLMRSKSGEVRDALEAARGRVHAIASSHRRLRLGGDLETTDAQEFLTAVLDDLKSTATGADAVELVGEVEPIVINARDATTIGIVVGELVTNAYKHAFADGRSGRIVVKLFRGHGDWPTLVVFDDGRGVPETVEPGDGGLGSVIIKQLAQQFGGVPVYERRASGGLSVTVPLPNLEGAKRPVPSA